MFKDCGKRSRYRRVKLIGKGGNADVFEHVDEVSGAVVAVKRVFKGRAGEGVNMAAVRELQLMQEIHHPNILQLLDVYADDDQIHMVLDYCPTSLEDIISDQTLSIRLQDVKSYMHMALTGLAYVHSQWITHRDLKPGNLLIGADRCVKIADFGLGSQFGSPTRKLHDGVVTMWYRAPELLFGAREYGPAVDMWSMGCIFAELLIRYPLFVGNVRGDSEIDQLSVIFALRGTPSESTWPGVTSLPGYVEFAPSIEPLLSEVLVGAPASALDLLVNLLQLDPSKRLSCEEALSHPYFAESPVATKPKDLPVPANALANFKRLNQQAEADGAAHARAAGAAGAGEDDTLTMVTD